MLEQTLSRMPDLSEAPEIASIRTTVERTRDPRHGDFTTNIAMRLAKAAGRKPREIAQSIIDALPDSELVDKVEIAGPGFINFHVSNTALHRELAGVLEDGENYGRQEIRSTPKILLEFVSANPTGPLHVGHGRHASYGATLGNLLEAAGYIVDREYYVNDAGRQMDILGVSVLLRMLEAVGETIPFPEAGYKGDYIRDIAADIKEDISHVSAVDLFADIEGDDKEIVVSALIANAERLLGDENIRKIASPIA